MKIDSALGNWKWLKSLAKTGFATMLNYQLINKTLKSCVKLVPPVNGIFAAPQKPRFLYRSGTVIRVITFDPDEQKIPTQYLHDFCINRVTAREIFIIKSTTDVDNIFEYFVLLRVMQLNLKHLKSRFARKVNRKEPLHQRGTHHMTLFRLIECYLWLLYCCLQIIAIMNEKIFFSLASNDEWNLKLRCLEKVNETMMSLAGPSN